MLGIGMNETFSVVAVKKRLRTLKRDWIFFFRTHCVDEHTNGMN